MILSLPVSALDATFRVDPSGSGYNASVQVEATDHFFFWDYGPLGERIPRKVEQISLSGSCGNCSFTSVDDTHITFPAGNYTLRYASGITDNHLTAFFETPYNVTVLLPPGLDLRNPLLGGMNPPMVLVTETEGGLAVSWNLTRSIEIRFYDRGQETLLYLFGTLWIAALCMALVPYLMVRRRK